MEATGIYWRPVWHILEGQFELVLANAQHIKNVPGRKTDVNDAMWIADLLAHGLIRASFVPPAPIQELRDLTRTRKQLVREIAQHSLRIRKVLEDANIKLGSVLSDVLTASGRAILWAIIGGESEPERLADLAQGNRAAQTNRTDRGAAWPGDRASPHDAQAASGPHRRPRSGSARSGHRSGKILGADPRACPPADDHAGHQ
jgi:transposase